MRLYIPQPVSHYISYHSSPYNTIVRFLMLLLLLYSTQRTWFDMNRHLEIQGISVASNTIGMGLFGWIQ
jgi:hypothetical protein